jgi:hypothetical protein
MSSVEISDDDDGDNLAFSSTSILVPPDTNPFSFPREPGTSGCVSTCAFVSTPEPFLTVRKMPSVLTTEATVPGAPPHQCAAPVEWPTTSVEPAPRSPQRGPPLSVILCSSMTLVRGLRSQTTPHDTTIAPYLPRSTSRSLPPTHTSYPRTTIGLLATLMGIFIQLLLPGQDRLGWPPRRQTATNTP